uniref:Uncharacterized protein n=1 Tax=Panagrellus redivivus TaxID=6233 RepID=A0A7E4UPY8_PANRE
MPPATNWALYAPRRTWRRAPTHQCRGRENRRGGGPGGGVPEGSSPRQLCWGILRPPVPLKQQSSPVHARRNNKKLVPDQR